MRVHREHGYGCVLLFGLAAAAHGGALITFDSPPAGLTANSFCQGCPVDPTAEVTTQFEDLGVILSTAAPGAPYAVLINLGVGHAVSGAYGIGSANAMGDVDYTQDIDIFLVVPGTTTPAVTDDISIRGDNIPSFGQVIFSAYDVSGNLIASNSQTDVGGNTYELSAPGIHEFRLHSQHGDVAYDNLAFDTPEAPSASGVVPEPATFGLIGFGIATMAFFRSRKLFAGQRSPQPRLRES